MKTKFILQGGFPKDGKQENDSFFTEILSTAPQDTKILLVLFAKEADRIEKNMKEDIEQFTKNSGGKNLVFDVATEESFLSQIQESDVIYFHGGHTGKLMETLKKFPEFPELLKGKVVAGDSAGANVLCAGFYSLRMGAGEGFGVLPVKVICHYVEENKNKLDEIRPDLETILLPELKFKVFYY
ncbi:MAG: Type 1 glutamine amidotransferase-like domain-containing protein [Patescibacteria group bacterium]